MNRIFKSISFVVAALGISVGANAISITASAINQTTSSVAGTSTINFDNGNCTGTGYISCSGNYLVPGTSVGGQYAAPYTDNTKYLTVGPYGSGSGISATLKLGATSDYFGLFWGSIDTYNTISFLLGNTSVASYDGVQVAAATSASLLANGGQQAWSSNRYINFDFGATKFDTVVFTSTEMAFESDNHAFRKVASVSEPMTLVLMGLGLFGLVATRRFKCA